MNRTTNQRGWFFVLPVVVLVSFSALVPLMTVVNYSVQDILGPGRSVFVGLDWYRKTLLNPEFHAALGRQLLFSCVALAIQIPLGIAVALAVPRTGRLVSATLILLALPLLIPWNVVGTIWQIFARPDIGLGGRSIAAVVVDYNYALNASHAWATVLLMDVWHWTPLVVLMCYAGLRSIPDAYYQAARIDGAGRWAIFRHIQLPGMGGVLMITVLLRFMDSFMIYTEPFVLTGGGPGNATTFLSQVVARLAVGQFDLGPAAAFSIIYFLLILLFCYVFYTLMMPKQD